MFSRKSKILQTPVINDQNMGSSGAASLEERSIYAAYIPITVPQQNDLESEDYVMPYTTTSYYRPVSFSSMSSVPPNWLDYNAGVKSKTKKAEPITEPVPTPVLSNKKEDLTDVLRRTLMQAFDEGSESPYDLRDSLVDDMLKKLKPTISEFQQAQQSCMGSPKLNIPSLDQLKTTFEEQIPGLIKECLQATPRAFLAGGSVVKMLVRPLNHGILPYNWDKCDWDIFVHTHDCGKLPVMHDPYLALMHKHAKEKEYNAQPNGLITAVLQNSKPIEKVGLINVITGQFNKMEDVLNSFDFCFLQTGCYYEHGQLKYAILNLQAWSDLVHGIIRITPEGHLRRKSDPTTTLSRIYKYIGRGFRDCTGCTELGLLPQYTKALATLDAEQTQPKATKSSGKKKRFSRSPKR